MYILTLLHVWVVTVLNAWSVKKFCVMNSCSTRRGMKTVAIEMCSVCFCIFKVCMYIYIYNYQQYWILNVLPWKHKSEFFFELVDLFWTLHFMHWNITQYVSGPRLVPIFWLAASKITHCMMITYILTHWGRVTQICVYTLQLCKTDDANLRF